MSTAWPNPYKFADLENSHRSRLLSEHRLWLGAYMETMSGKLRAQCVNEEHATLPGSPNGRVVRRRMKNKATRMGTGVHHSYTSTPYSTH